MSEQSWLGEPHVPSITTNSTGAVALPVGDKVPDRVIDAPIPYKTTVGAIDHIQQLEERRRLEAEKQETHTEGWNAVIEKLPPFNKMVWVATPMWFIGKDGSKEYSPFCDMACLKDGPVRVWMTPQFEGYTFEEITHWRPLPILPEPPAAKQGDPSSANRAEGNPNQYRDDHQPTETQKQCRELCGPRNFGYHDPACPIVRAAQPVGTAKPESEKEGEQ